MRRRHYPYHLGIIIPCVIIVVNGASAYYAVLRFDPYAIRRNFALAYACVWFTYVLAIAVRPGYAMGEIVPGAQYVKCAKCGLPKPERAHHCRVCNRCVLRMDHHCPWTENCVGYRNVGYFLRFVGSAASLTGYCTYRCVRFLLFLLHYRRHLARVCPQRTRIWVAVFSALANAFICLGLAVLWIRVALDVLHNQTQIEGWEIERAQMLARKKLAPKRHFPFDVGFYQNVVQAVGPVYTFLWPFGAPHGRGHVYPKFLDDGSRWPPVDPREVQEHDYYRKDRWINFEGETLGDFGVDAAENSIEK